MDRLEAMSLLVAAAETGSLSAAARSLGKPLTSVSRKIAALEDHLDVQLLTRSVRQCTLTDAGRLYADACRRILEEVRDADRNVSGKIGEPRGDLVITAPLIFGRLYVVPVIAEFLRIYPKINIRLALSDHMTNLLEEDADVAFQLGDLPDSSLMATRLGATKHVVCGSPTYFAARGIPTVPSDLARHECVTINRLVSPTLWRFGPKGAELDVPITSRLVVNTAEAALEAAIAGLGITYGLSFYMVPAITTGRLVPILADFEPPQLAINLLYAPRRYMPQKLRTFYDFVVPRLRDDLSKATSLLSAA